MPWMPSLKTGILAGVGACARHIASHIADADRRAATTMPERVAAASPAAD
jgi:hypothetical protein